MHYADNHFRHLISRDPFSKCDAIDLIRQYAKYMWIFTKGPNDMIPITFWPFEMEPGSQGAGYSWDS